MRTRGAALVGFATRERGQSPRGNRRGAIAAGCARRTLPSVQPLANQPDPAGYVGTYTRPSNTVVVRAEGGKLFVKDGATEMSVAFYGPDRVVVLDGAE